MKTKFGTVFAASIMATLTAPATASIVINIDQVGSDVVATGSGALNITGLNLFLTTNPTDIISSGSALIRLGGTGNTIFGEYSFAGSGATNFGTDLTSHVSSSSTGDVFGVYGGARQAFLPRNYVSGTALAGTATFAGQSLASLGLTTGTYTINTPADFFTVNVGLAPSAVPELTTWAMMILGFGITGLAMRRRSNLRTTVRYA